jgi:5-dehydro-4-deoxyglucarate dehydratase
MKLDGLLFFPVTPFAPGPDSDPGRAPEPQIYGIDAAALAAHIEQGLAHDPGAVFVACGTGEYHAMTAAEHRRAVEVAVAVTGGAVPVIAGVGGSLPGACATARQAAEAGADGVLILPPYLVAGDQAGLVGYIRLVAEAGRLPAIVYQRSQVRFDPASAVAVASHPLVVGFKDGLGDLDLLQRIISAIRSAGHDDISFFNGLPTAELTMKAYCGLGVDLYSSAVFAFLPEVAVAFHRALACGDTALVDLLLDRFYVPLVNLRDRVPGYAVSLIKAGVVSRGLDVGGVRLPLVDPTPEDRAELDRLIDIGLELAGA